MSAPAEQLAAESDGETEDLPSPRLDAEQMACTIRHFVAGSVVDEDALRASVRAYVEQHRALDRSATELDRAWSELLRMFAELAKQASALSGLHYETWHPDRYVRGQIHGEASTWRHVAVLLSTLVNASHLRKAAHGDAAPHA